MRGSIRKRGSTWTAYWSVPGRLDPTTGKADRRQKTRGGFARQKDAQQFLNDTLVKVDQGVYAEPSKQPLSVFLETEWLPAIRGTVRPLTHLRYTKIVRTYLASRDIGNVPLRALSPGHCNALLAELERDGLSIATRRLTHATLRRALAHAVKWGKLPRNVASSADPPAAERSRVQSWSARELRQFLEAVQEDRFAALWRLAATTGMRRGELAGLCWRNVDLDAGRLQVTQQIVPTNGGCTVGPPKSRRSERTIALDAETAEALRHHRELQLLEREFAGPAYSDADYVFADELGAPVDPRRLTERFTQLRKAAGIPVGTLHGLRHTCISMSLLAGAPLHVVAARAGDDPTTILSSYAHLLPTSGEEVAALMATALSEGR